MFFLFSSVTRWGKGKEVKKEEEIIYRYEILNIFRVECFLIVGK